MTTDESTWNHLVEGFQVLRGHPTLRADFVNEAIDKLDHIRPDFRDLLFIKTTLGIEAVTLSQT